ncbi:IMPACT family protein, partial [Escherichia coli]
EEALAFLEAQREPQATHNCYAYKLGNLYRFFDDGEPTGTAGKPILHAIEAQGLDRVVVLVVRYFGGIKLGAGGLVRAYGGVAAEALRRASTVPLREWEEVRFVVP